MFFSIRNAVLLGATILLLTACGGGGGSDAPVGNTPPPAQNSPSVAVLFPAVEGLTFTQSVSLRGTVSDPDGDSISVVEFKDSTGTVLASTVPTAGNWSQSVDLQSGPNQISIEATDARGAVGSTTISLHREILLSATKDLRMGTAADEVYLYSRLGDESIVGHVNTQSRTRSIVSGNGVGTGPELTLNFSHLVRNSVDGSLIVFRVNPSSALLLDSQNGNRTEFSDTSAAGTIHDAVVDAGANRVLILNTDQELWSMSLQDGTLSMVGLLDGVSGSATYARSMAVSSDGSFLYLNTGEVIAEVDLQTLGIRELTLDAPLETQAYMVLDENQNRIIYSHYQSLFAVDRGTGVNRTLVTFPEEDLWPGPMTMGPVDNEVLIAPQDRDQLFGFNTASGVLEELAGSHRGVGSRDAGFRTVGDLSRGVIYSFAPVDGATPAEESWNLVEIDLVTGDRSTINTDFGGALGSTGINGRTLLNDGNVLIVVSGISNGIYRVDPATGQGVQVAEFNPPFVGVHLCYDDDTEMAYTTRGIVPTALMAIDLADDTASIFSSEEQGIGSGPAIVIPNGIACDPGNSRVLVADGAENQIVAVDFGSGDRTVVSGPTAGAGDALVNPQILAMSPDGGALYVSLGTGHGVVRIALDSGDRSTLEIEADQLPSHFQILSMAMGDEDIAYITDQYLGIWNIDLVTGEMIAVSK